MNVISVTNSLSIVCYFNTYLSNTISIVMVNTQSHIQSGQLPSQTFYTGSV